MENHFDILNVYAHRSSRCLEPLLKERAQEGWTEHDLDGMLQCGNMIRFANALNAIGVTMKNPL